MRVERKRGRKVFTPRAVDLQRQVRAMQPVVAACEARQRKAGRLNCEKPAIECVCTIQHNLAGHRDVELGLKPWEPYPDDLIAELDRIANDD